MSEQPAPAPAPTASKSSRLGVTLAVVIAAAAAAGAFWWGRHGAAAPPTAEAKSGDRGIVSFEPFVVNLADPGASRFLRVTVQLVVPNAEAAERVQKTPVLLMQARSAILELLTLQTSTTLVTPDGKTALKKEIAGRVDAAIGELKVVDVLFSDFVIQF